MSYKHAMAATLITLLATTPALAVDFDMDFQRKHDEANAEAMFYKGEFAKAQQAFEKLADTAKDDVAKAMWNARAAVALGRQEDKYEQGMSLAKQVPVRPYAVLAQMRLIQAERDRDAIAETFKDEKILDWPAHKTTDKRRAPAEDVRVHALYMRAVAHYRSGNGEAAAQDAENALALVSDGRLEADLWLTLARTRSRYLDDEEGAFEAHQHIVELRNHTGGATWYRGVIGTARYLSTQGKHEEALNVLNRMDPHDQKGWWHGAGLLALGQIHTNAGDTDKAIAAYRELLGEDQGHRNHRGAARLALGALLTEAGRTDEAIEVYQALIDNEDARNDDKEKAQQAIEKLKAPAEGDE